MAKPSLNGLPNTFVRPVFPLATSSPRILVGACPLNPNLTPSMLRAQVPERRRINGGYLPLLRVAQWRVSWAKTGAPNLWRPCSRLCGAVSSQHRRSEGCARSPHDAQPSVGADRPTASLLAALAASPLGGRST